MPPARPLTLHASALSDVEHELYTESLKDILSPVPTQDSPETNPFFEHANVGVRETRAWIRGRYPSISSDQVDAILRLIGSKDSVMTAGQFFAAQRLVHHVLNGEAVESKWVFIQASHANTRRTSATFAPPLHPFRSKTRTPSPSKNPFTSPPPVLNNLPPPPPTHHKPGPSIPPKPKSVSLATKNNSNNPFLPPPPHPVLPPRKAPAHAQAPPISTVLTNANAPSLVSMSPTRIYTPSLNNVRMFQPDIISPKPVHPPPPSNQTVARILTTHVTSPLIKMSLEASKEEREKRLREEEMERERIVGVLKSSSTTRVGGSSSRSRSTSAASISTMTSSSDEAIPRRKKPPLPVRRPSVATTVGAMSNATLCSSETNRAQPPSQPKARPYRSNSHDKDGPPAPPPPRRRPESMSVPSVKSLTTSQSSPLPTPTKASATATATSLARALSLSTRGARYKAEASLAKRGFIPSSGWVDDSSRADSNANAKVGLLRAGDEPGPDTDDTNWGRERETFKSELRGEEWGEL